MIAGRLRKRFAEQDWFAVAVEVAIVLVGVFLGIQANNWNEARLDRARAHSYHIRLIEDLRATEQGARASFDYYRDAHDHALATLAGFDRPAASLGTPFLVNAYQATQIFNRAARRSTYDEILSSGDAELIGAADLRTRLANFYWRQDALIAYTSIITPYRSRLRGLLPYAVQARILARCEETRADNGGGMLIVRLPRDCLVTVPPNLSREAVAALRAAPGLKQDLTFALADLDLKLNSFRLLVASARAMRAELEKSSS